MGEFFERYVKQKLLLWVIVSCAPFFFLLVFIGSVELLVTQQMVYAEASIQESFQTYHGDVEKFREFVTKKTEEEGIGGYVNHILAIMQIETLGQGTDVMNGGNKESNTQYPKEIGGILDPYYSITCGIKEFKYLLKQKNITGVEDRENLKVVYQSYHVGREFLPQPYTVEIAEKYLADRGLPLNLRAEFAEDVDFLVHTLPLDEGGFIFPVPGYIRVSSPFGERIDPISGATAFHTGTDFPAPKGTPIVASADGVVEKNKSLNYGYGNYVVIKHTGQYKTLYAHMSASAVENQQVVKKGEVIGYVGSTGYSTGNHLHLEIQFNGEVVDPMILLERKEV